MLDVGARGQHNSAAAPLTRFYVLPASAMALGRQSSHSAQSSSDTCA